MLASTDTSHGIASGRRRRCRAARGRSARAERLRCCMASVGVVIAAYNPQPEHLTRALGSVLAQTCDDWTCVLVDDGSEPRIRLKRSLGDDRVSVLRQDNRGVSAARNVGVAAVQGTYIAFLDQDDEWLPAKLERQIAFMRERKLALSDTDFEIIRNHEQIARGYEYHHGDFRRLLSTARLGLSTMVVRRDVFESVGGFNSAFPTVQDWEFALRVAYAGHPFDRLREVLCAYHLHEENASKNYQAAYREQLALLRLYEMLDVRPDVRAATRTGRRRMRELYAYQAIDSYRSSRRAADVAWAARRAPRVLLRAAVAKALAR